MQYASGGGEGLARYTMPTGHAVHRSLLGIKTGIPLRVASLPNVLEDLWCVPLSALVYAAVCLRVCRCLP